jgi:enoyl-CoA hydratase/carnithine racemase
MALSYKAPVDEYLFLMTEVFAANDVDPAEASEILAHSRAAELLMLGEKFSAEHAQEVGIVTSVWEPLTLAAHVDSVARKLANQAPLAMKRTKALMRDPAADSLLQRIEVESVVFGECIASAEFEKARTAFREKRPPNFAMTD